MKTHAALLVIVLLGTAGCAGSKPSFYWFHPDRTFEEAKIDYAECEVQAQEEAEKITQEEYFERLRSPVVLSGDEEAMKKRKKQRKSEDPASLAREEWRDLYKQNAFSGCMTSRGYVQLREHQVSGNLKTKTLPLGAIAGRRPE
jgi:glutaredoxin